MSEVSGDLNLNVKDDLYSYENTKNYSNNNLSLVIDLNNNTAKTNSSINTKKQKKEKMLNKKRNHT